MNLADLRIKIFADGADIASIKELRKNPLIKGFTTNPSLMRAAGAHNYTTFAMGAHREADGLPISFEVIADDFEEMERQARVIASWGENVYVKIPITNTKGESSGKLIRRLSEQGVKVNVTAALDERMTAEVAWYLSEKTPSILSIFAGRIADTGVDPLPFMRRAVEGVDCISCEILWASTRELLNIFQADAAGVDIITVTPDLLKKLPLVGKDLGEYSLETVRQFYADAVEAGYTL